MSNPSTIDQIKASVIRLVSSGVSRRLKVVDASSDGKIVDAADISGNAGVAPSQVTFGAASAGDPACVAAGNHVHQMPTCTANSFVGNATDSDAVCAPVAVPASSILGRTATGSFRAITKLANRVLAWNAAGDLYQMQVEPGMMAGIAPNAILTNATSAAASPTALAVAVQSVLIRAAGNIVSQAIAASSVLGRNASGDLGSVKVSPDMQQRLYLNCYPGAGTSGSVVPLTLVSKSSSWAAINGSNQITIPETGMYRVSVCVRIYAPSNSSTAQLELGLNWRLGATTNAIICSERRISAASTEAVQISGFFEYSFTAGDLLSFVYASSVGSTAISTDGAGLQTIVVERMPA